MRLSAATIDRLPEGVARFAYDRAAQAIGIVHFGIGAFHRAHQAWYTDLCMDAGERDWAISGVSLRSATVAEQLNPQDSLYTLTERSGGEAAMRRMMHSLYRVATSASRTAPMTRVAASPPLRSVSV